MCAVRATLHTGVVLERGATTTGRAPIVVSKIRRPRLRTGELHRERLVAELGAAGMPVVAVLAPAGYGKTTTLRQWVEVDPRPSAWVGLDPADNDPVRLLRHVVRALDGLVPLPEVEALLAVEPPPVAAVLPALATALGGENPLLLVLDDVHVVEHERVAALLEWLADALPPASTLALAGRSEPPMRLARHVAGDDALVLRATDLAFTPSEFRVVLDAALPSLDPAQVAPLYERTEGWPAGLHLSVLAAAAAPDPGVVLADLPHRAQDLGRYFHEELLRHLDADVRDFLVRTAVLDRLSPGLCDAVLERDDSGPMLRSLSESGNLFVVAHDAEPESLRYHHLFADLLVAELRAEDPALEPVLRRRAARWLDVHGDPDAAVSQAHAAGDRELAATIAYRHAPELMQLGMIDTLARWVEPFPLAVSRRNPLLMLLHGWVAFGAGRRDDVHRWLELAEGAHWEGPLPDGTPSLEVARASLSMFHAGSGVKQTVRDARVVREAGPGASPWWSTAAMFEATATTLADRDADAVALIEEAEFASRGSLSTHAVCLSHLAWACLRAGDDLRGLALAAEAIAELREHHLETYNLATNVPAVHAYAMARQGRRDDHRAAVERVDELLASLGGAVPRAQCQIRLILAESALLLDDADGAAAFLAAAEPFLAAEPDAVVLWDAVDDIRGRLADRARQARAISGYRLTDADLRVLAELPTHRSLEEIGRVLYISRNTVKTHAVSIYRKLGVSGRSAAVERARSLGLIDEVPAGR